MGTLRARIGERPLGTAAYGRRGFKERTGVSGGRPTGAARFRQQSTWVSCHPPPPPPEMHRVSAQLNGMRSPLLSMATRELLWPLWTGAPNPPPPMSLFVLG